MYIVPIAWLYVALLMAVAEATSPIGTVMGAVITFLLYGVLPIALVMYVMGTPARKRAIRTREASELAAARLQAQTPLEPETPATPQIGSGPAPDAGGETPADPVTPVRKEA